MIDNGLNLKNVLKTATSTKERMFLVNNYERLTLYNDLFSTNNMERSRSRSKEKKLNSKTGNLK